MIKTLLRNGLLKESFHLKSNDYYIDEMAYPTSFNMDEFKSIKSYKGKLDYAKQHLLGKLGAGSSRAVFKIDDEKVLKIALNEKGLEQNREESEYYKQEYRINAKVFDVDHDDYWLEMEVAKKVSPKRFEELTGISIKTLYYYLQDLHQRQTNRRVFSIPLTSDDIDKIQNNDWVVDLMDFIYDYQYPIPGDFQKISSYGEVLRDGVPTIVLIDFGFSESVSQTYNKGRKY
jgi:hypothetical protein